MNIKLMIIIIGSLLMGYIACGGPMKLNNDQAITKNSAAVTLKSSPAWTNLQNQLAQYDSHHTDATNKIDTAVNIADVKSAVVKTNKSVDDVHDALVKLIKCFQDYVAANNQ